MQKNDPRTDRQLDLFDALQPSAESIDTEFKSARGGLPGSFWESYSAMANTHGGTIFLGVVEKGSELSWEGVPDAAHLRTVLWNQLNDRQKVSRNLLSDTNGRMQELTGEHPKDITDMLRAFVRKGFLVQQNQRRWASYRLAGDSPQSQGDSPHSAPDSLHFPVDLWTLAEPARKRAKVPSAELRQLIASLCQGRWLTARELGQLLDRNADNLQTRFLTAMVREGRLILRHPDVPNRPDQAYATAGTIE